MRGRRFARGWKWILVALISTLVAALPASATVYVRGTFHDEYSDSFDDCGFVINLEGSADGKYRVRTGKNKLDTAFFQRINISYQDTYTNAATGEWFLVRGHEVFNEVKARRVEGTIFEFRSVEAGQPFVVENSAGDVILRDRGAIMYTILFDTLGDDEPGGDFIQDVDVQVHGPHPGFTDFDFCEFATEQIG
jgi:hypothetical protein